MSESFARETLNQVRKKLGMSEEQQGPEQTRYDTERKLRERIEQLERALKNTQDDFIEQLERAEKETCLRIDAEAKLSKAVKAAFNEGFLAAAADGWINNPRIETEWKRSEARTTIDEL